MIGEDFRFGSKRAGDFAHLRRAGDIHGFEVHAMPAVEQSAVHRLHRRSALVVGFHFQKRETTAPAGLAIHDYFRRGDVAELGEGFLQTLGRDRIGQIAHKQFTTH